MTQFWILRNGKPVPTDDVMEWGRLFGAIDNHRIALTRIGQYEISTVFIGLDHNFSLEGPPLLFETMVFRNEDATDLLQWRYATWAEAEMGHHEAVAAVRQRLKIAAKTLDKHDRPRYTIKDMNRMLTVQEVAERLDVSYEAVRQWILGGKLRAMQPAGKGGVYRIPESEIEKLLSSWNDLFKPRKEDGDA